GNVRDVLDIIPLDRILTETDSPYLAPMPKRGKRNEPAYVSYTGEYIANHLNMSVEELQEQVMKNYKTMYKKI
ncbi:TatD family hydrolase, partial [Faecalibacterium prausnitzii]